MTKKDYEIIANSIWRSGFIKDKNQIRQTAGERMRSLIASTLIGELKQKRNFDEKKFLITCGINN